MSKTKYRICMSVPLGTRSGTMLLDQSDSKISGWLEVMGRKNQVCGSLSSNGNVALSGALQTLLHTIPFAATGTIHNRQIF